jgi:hypothetical protein
LHKISTEKKQQKKKVMEGYINELESINKKTKGVLDEEEARSLGFSAAAETEDSVLTAAEKKKKKELLATINSELDDLRKDILSEQQKAIESDQDKVKRLVEDCGGTFVSKNAIISSVTATIPLSCLQQLDSSDKIAEVYENKLVEAQLDVSVPSILASTWYSAGYNGSTWDLAVADTGIDGTHPALTVDYAQTFHSTTAQSHPSYDDNASSTDDLQGHGSHCAGIVTSTDATYKGGAHGMDDLINAKFGWKGTDNNGYGYWSDAVDAIHWAVNTAGADTISFSFGGSYGVEDSSMSRFMDAVVDDLLVPVAVSAGNSGIYGTGTVTDPAIAYNIFSVANMRDQGTTSRSDDSISSSSSRGYTSAGRVKPDITAPGDAIMSANHNWETGNDFINKGGTSMAAPHVAASVLLVLDYKGSLAWDPRGVKALLLNTAESNGSFTNKQNFGWGYIDLDHAYTHRDDVVLDSVDENGDYKLYNGSLVSGEKATLVWHRHVDYNNDNYPSTYYSLNDLNLYMYDRNTGALLDSSLSSVDNVEQVESSGSYDVVIKVYSNTTNFYHSSDNESFALATEEDFSNVSGPNLSVSQSYDSSINDSDLPLTITTTISNTGDVNAHDINVTLNLPSNLSLSSGSGSNNISRVNDGSSNQTSWNITTDNLGTYTSINSSYDSSIYGLSYSGNTASGSLTITDEDTSPPVFSDWDYNSSDYAENNITISVNITDQSSINYSRLYYDYSDDSTIDGYVNMTNSSNIWNTSIPAPGNRHEGNNISFVVESADNDNDRSNDSVKINSSEQYIFMLNTAPNITIHSPTDTTYMTSPIDLNISVSEEVRWLNRSLDSGTNITLCENCSNYTGTMDIWGGNHSLTVFAVDFAGNSNSSTVNFTGNMNDPPVAENVTLNSTDSSNRSNGTLVGSWGFSDTENDDWTDNETKWYNNSIEVSVFTNLSSVDSTYTRRDEVWKLSVRVYDGTNWSAWVNSSALTIQNLPPVLETINNITVNETETVNITMNVTDEDTLTYGINDSRFSQSVNEFTWNTNLTDSGNYTVRLNVTDGVAVVYQDVFIVVIDADDFDNDGNPDFNDTDDDNDGLADASDTLTGNANYINSTVAGIKIIINNSENTSKAFDDTYTVNVTDQENNTIIEFDWNFSNSTLIVNWTIDYNASNGTIRIQNLDLTSQGLTKTVYINKSDSSHNYVCIADDETTSWVSSDCSGQTKISCSSSGQCIDLGDSFKVSGLSHSFVRGIYVSPPVSSGGGGGGGGGSTQTSVNIIPTIDGVGATFGIGDEAQLFVEGNTYTLRTTRVSVADILFTIDNYHYSLSLFDKVMNIDIDKDAKRDITVELEEIKNNKATLSFKIYVEPVRSLPVLPANYSRPRRQKQEEVVQEVAVEAPAETVVEEEKAVVVEAPLPVEKEFALKKSLLISSIAALFAVIVIMIIFIRKKTVVNLVEDVEKSIPAKKPDKRPMPKIKRKLEGFEKIDEQISDMNDKLKRTKP